jgi:hypothetical protein
LVIVAAMGPKKCPDRRFAPVDVRFSRRHVRAKLSCPRESPGLARQPVPPRA